MTTPSTRISRLSEMQSTSRGQLDVLLDGTPLATVALVRDGHPVIFPTGFARVGDVWALRYPDTNELWVLERTLGSVGDLSADTGITRVFSGQLAILPATVIASQPMDTNPLWRMLESGELIQVDSELRVTSTIAVPDPPAEMLELTAHEAAAQEEDPAPSADPS